MLNHAQEFGLRRLNSRAYNRHTTRNFERQVSLRGSNFLKIRKGQPKAKVIKECSICFNTFKDNDEIVECMLLHVFHADCFESNRENNEDVKCPTCG